MIFKGIKAFFKHYLMFAVTASLVISTIGGTYLFIVGIFNGEFDLDMLKIAIAQVPVGSLAVYAWYKFVLRKVYKRFFVKFIKLGELEAVTIKEQKEIVVDMIEKSKKKANNWGELVTYFCFYRTEMWFFKKGVLVIDRDDNHNVKLSVFIPKMELNNCMTVNDRNGVFSVCINIQGCNVVIEVGSDLVRDFPNAIGLISRFKKYCEDLNINYADKNDHGYSEFCQTIKQLKESGFVIGSYMVDLNKFTSEMFPFYKEDIGIIGRNKNTEEVYITVEGKVIKEKLFNFSYEIEGTIDTQVYEVYDENASNVKFNVEGYIMGSILGGEVGGAMHGIEIDDSLKYKLKTEKTDNRRVSININQNMYKLPLASYGLLKELYPTNERVKYQNVKL